MAVGGRTGPGDRWDREDSSTATRAVELFPESGALILPRGRPRLGGLAICPSGTESCGQAAPRPPSRGPCCLSHDKVHGSSTPFYVAS